MTMPRNLLRVELQRQADGSMKPVPIPFDCACGEPACYGAGGIWSCTKCWQAKQ